MIFLTETLHNNQILDERVLRELLKFKFNGLLVRIQRDAYWERIVPEGSYHFIPCIPEEALAGVFILRKYYYEISHKVLGRYKTFPETFIDLGCGPGQIMYLMEIFFDLRTYGIEFSPLCVEAGKKAGIRNITQGDFFDNLELVKGKDIIYTYMPMYKRDNMEKLQKLVFEVMDVGAIWIEMLPRYGDGKAIHIKTETEILALSGEKELKKYCRGKNASSIG